MELLTDRGGGNHFYSHTQQKSRAQMGVGGCICCKLGTPFLYGKLAFRYSMNLRHCGCAILYDTLTHSPDQKMEKILL